jgi:hypothetical protein
MDYAKVILLGGSIIASAWVFGSAVQMGIQHGCSILGEALQQGLISHGEAIQAGLEYHPLFIKEQFK